MRAIGAAAAAARRHAPLLPTSYAAFSSSSSPGFGGGGGGGAGRGRGRGLPPSPTPNPRAPGRIPTPAADDDGDGDGAADPFSFSPSPIGRGRGETMIQSASPSIPPFAAASRGRGSPLPTPPLPPPSGEVSESASSFDPPPPPPPRPLPSSGAGRGMPRMQQQPVDKPQGQEENRFIRRQEEKKAAAAAASASASPPPASPRSSSQPKLSAEDAVKRALELLSAGDAGRGRSDNKGGKRQDNRRVPGRHPADGEDQLAMFLGDNAHGDRLEKRLGEEKMKIFNQAFEDAADNALPSPMEYAYLEAAHTNNMIEFEPEYNVNFGNPDIDEKPPMSLEDMLQKVKPFIIAYEGIQNQEEWEEAVKDVMARAPRMKEVIDMYSGPDVVTAKQQEEELQRVANTLPGNIPSSVKRFTDKTLLSLKNNPGWGFDKKCQFMDKFAREVSDLYK